MELFTQRENTRLGPDLVAHREPEERRIIDN